VAWKGRTGAWNVNEGTSLWGCARVRLLIADAPIAAERAVLQFNRCDKEKHLAPRCHRPHQPIVTRTSLTDPGFCGGIGKAVGLPFSETEVTPR